MDYEFQERGIGDMHTQGRFDVQKKLFAMPVPKLASVCLADDTHTITSLQDA